MALHFTEEEDRIILREVLACPPCEANYGQVQHVWEKIARYASSAANRTMEARSVRDHFTCLLNNFKKRSAASQIPDPPSERDQILEEYLDLCEDVKRRGKPRTSDAVAEARQTNNMVLKRSREEARAEQNENESVDVPPNPRLLSTSEDD